MTTTKPRKRSARVVKAPRVTMNAARKSAIYAAVHEIGMQLRIDLRPHVTDWIDARLSKAFDRAGNDALAAALPAKRRAQAK